MNTDIISKRTFADWISIAALIPIFLGYDAIFAQDPYGAIIFFVIAFFLDFLDGFVARKSQTGSTFGKHLDAFADHANYVMGSCVFVIVFVIQNHTIALITGIIALIAGTLRLARFSDTGFAKDPTTTELFYRGLPVPFLSLCVFTLFFLQSLVPANIQLPLSIFSITMVSWLMITTYRIPKKYTLLWFILAITLLCLALYNIQTTQ